MNSFFTFAKSVSSEHMQTLWGRVLAKEVGKPGSFSIRSLEILKRMTHREALSFTTACKLAASFSARHPRDIIVKGYDQSYDRSLFSLFLPVKDYPEIDLRRFHLYVTDQMNLTSIGILYEEKLTTGPLDREEDVRLYFAKSVLVLIPRSRKRKLYLGFIKFTQVRMELSTLVSEEDDITYFTNLKENLASGFVVKEIPRNG